MEPSEDVGDAEGAQSDHDALEWQRIIQGRREEQRKIQEQAAAEANRPQLKLPAEYKRAFEKNKMRIHDLTKNIKTLFTDIDEPFVAVALKQKLA